MFNLVKRFFKWLMYTVKLTNFFCQVSLLECKLEDALKKCEILQEEIRDKVILDDLKAIEYRIDYARSRMLCVRNRGKSIFEYENGKGL